MFMHFVDAVARHAKKILNNHFKAETISKMTIHSQLLQNYFTPAKIYISEMTKFWQGENKKIYMVKLYYVYCKMYNVQ